MCKRENILNQLLMFGLVFALLFAALFVGCDAIEGTPDEVLAKVKEANASKDNPQGGISYTVEVSVSPASVVVTRGQNQQFVATVVGASNTAVTWAVTGGTQSSISNGGLLSVGAAEVPETKLTVTATSVADTSKKGYAEVTVSSLVNAIAPSLEGWTKTSYIYTENTSATSLSINVMNTGDIASQKGNISYQWYRNTVESNTGGTVISDQTNPSYTPSATTAYVGTFYYYVVVKNTISDNQDGGFKTISSPSEVITVTVNPILNAKAPRITGQPAGSTVTKTTAVTLTVTADTDDGGTLSYQWFSSAGNPGNPPSGGLAISGATSDSYNPPTASVDTIYYYVIITNKIADNSDGGNKTAISVSDAAKVIVNEAVNAKKPIITTSPADASYVRGSSVPTLSVVASSPDGGGLTYQWCSNTSKTNSGGTLIDGATSTSYTPPADTTTATGKDYYFYVVVTNTIEDNHDGGAKTATANSSAATVTVKVNAASPTNISISGGGSFKINTLVSLSVTASSPDGGSLTYQWCSNSSNNNSSGSEISGATNATYSYTPNIAAAGTTMYYYVVITNTNTGVNGTQTATAVSNTVTVTIKQVFTVTFNSNGGSAVSSQQVSDGETATRPDPAPTRTGYTFDNWYVDPSLQTLFDFPNTPIDKNTFIYAKWTATPVSGVSLNKTTLTLTWAETGTLIATVLPGDALNKTVSWSSSNTGIITVDQSGNLSPHSVGAASITIKTDDGNKTAVCAVTVSALVEMVPVPGGSFELGKELGTAGSGDTTPTSTVTLTGFQMGKYQVTQAQYQAVMGTNPSYFTTANGRPPDAGETDANRPVEEVSWYDAVEFCNALSGKEGLTPYYTIHKDQTDPNNTDASDPYKWLVTIITSANGYRLPTEAQWEYAAKGGNTGEKFTYSGSNDPNAVAWYSLYSGKTGGVPTYTHGVGLLAPNGLLIYDMSGNVWEWCWDWYGSYTNTAKTDLTATGASSGAQRVSRGGGWNINTTSLRSVFRAHPNPYSRNSIDGFRVCLP